MGLWLGVLYEQGTNTFSRLQTLGFTHNFFLSHRHLVPPPSRVSKLSAKMDLAKLAKMQQSVRIGMFDALMFPGGRRGR